MNHHDGTAARDAQLAEVVPYLHRRVPVRLLRGNNPESLPMPVSGDALAQCTRGSEKTEAKRAKMRAAASAAAKQEAAQPTLFELGAAA